MLTPPPNSPHFCTIFHLLLKSCFSDHKESNRIHKEMDQHSYWKMYQILYTGFVGNFYEYTYTKE